MLYFVYDFNNKQYSTGQDMGSDESVENSDSNALALV